MQKVIEIKEATVYCGRTCVFTNLSLEVDQGCHTVILGPNGAGKSTLLKLLARELYPVQRAGSYVRVWGHERWNVWELRSHFGIVSHDLQHHYLGTALGLDVILSGYYSSIDTNASQQFSAAQRERAHQLMHLLGVAALKDRPFATLSTGEQRRFLDDEDLQQQLREWLLEVNTQRPSRATGVVPEERMKQERPRLRPLKVAPEELALRFPVTVGPTGVVLHDTHTYSMPPDSLGIPGTLYLYRDRVRIVAGRFEAVHQRIFGPPGKSTLPEHRAQRVAAASGKRAKRYMEREHLLEVGGVALEYLTELTHRRPRVWIRDVERLHALLEQHGDAALRSAVERGLAEHAIGAEYIAHYLSTAPPAPSPSSGAALQPELPL